MPSVASERPQKAEKSSRVLVVGCGYLGFRVATAAHATGHAVFGTTRNDAKSERLANLGITPIRYDWNDPRCRRSLPEVDRVLVAVSYDRNSSVSRYDSQVGGFGQLLSQVGPAADVCYISTTGVYHQTGGEWVDENSPTNPSREGGRVHLQAEQLLHRLRPQSAWTILRLAGIYGPGRVPRVADVLAGRPIRSAQDGYLNLIHVDDSVSAVLGCWGLHDRMGDKEQNGSAKGGRRGISRQRRYVVADDQPVIRGDFYRQIATLAKVPPPTFADVEPGTPTSMRSESNKRIWNRSMKRDLVARLRYPTYREGLQMVLDADVD